VRGDEGTDLLARRVGILERYVHAHEQTIQKALAMFSEYLAAQEQAPEKPTPGNPEGRATREDNGHDDKPNG
jgi:hypothetical protein